MPLCELQFQKRNERVEKRNLVLLYVPIYHHLSTLLVSDGEAGNYIGTNEIVGVTRIAAPELIWTKSLRPWLNGLAFINSLYKAV